MYLSAIRQSIQNLKQKDQDLDLTPEDISSREPTSMMLKRIRSSYYQQTLEQLESVLDNHKGTGEKKDLKLAWALETFLSRNWSFINGTLLSYTALPTADITRLLTQVAYLVAKEKNKYLSVNEPQCVPLQLLMPTLSIESIKEGYDDFCFETDIARVLQTHVLGVNGACLLPVSLLTELDLSVPHPELNNPYFDCYNPLNTADNLSKPGCVSLDSDEGKRLIEHSQFTQALMGFKATYDILVNDNSHLLGQLRQLCRQLTLYRAGAGGTEENAGGGAYPAIIAFMTYYNNLSDDEKEKIPELLKTEIDLLFQMSTDLAINTANMIATCIAIRGDKLTETMREHEKRLSEITLADDKRQFLIDEAKTNFEKARGELLHAITSGRYAPTNEGRANRPITLKLLHALGMLFEIASSAELAIPFLEELSVAEITEILKDKDPTLKQQLFQHIEGFQTVTDMETLILFAAKLSPELLLSGLSPEKQKLCLKAIMEELSQQFIHTPANLEHLLFLLDRDRCRVVCEELQDTLKPIIKSASDFSLLNFFFPEKFALLIAQFPDLINSANDMTTVLKPLSPEQGTAVVCQAMRERLPDIIKSARDFNRTICDLTQEKRSVIYQAMQHRLPAMVTSIDNFTEVIEHLLPEQGTIVLQVMQESLPNIIKTRDDLARVLEPLSPEQFHVVLQYMQALLPNIIKSSFDLAWFLKPRSPEQRHVVLQVMQESLPNIIKSNFDLARVLEPLSPEQCRVVLQVMQESLPNIIKLSFDLAQVLKPLSPEQRHVVLQVMQEGLPNIIKSNFDLARVLKPLSPEQCHVVLQVMQESLPNIIKSPRDFNSTLCDLTQENRTVVYQAMQHRLPAMVTSIYVLTEVIEHLLPEQRAPLCQTKLPRFIKSAARLNLELFFLSPHKCSLLLQVMQDRLPHLIKSVTDFIRVLRKSFSFIDLDIGGYQYSLPPEQRAVVFEAMQNILPDIITSAGDLAQVRKHLSEEQCTAVTPMLTLLIKMKTILSIEEAKTLTTALLRNDKEVIKAHIVQAIHDANQHRPGIMCTFFSSHSPLSRLIDVLSRLEVEWIERIDVALALGLTKPQLSSQKDIKGALEHCVMRTNEIRQPLVIELQPIEKPTRMNP